MSNSNTVTVRTACCVVCGKSSILEVPRAGFEAWRAGALIQNALPDMPKEQREILISGTHPTCWDALGR